MKRFYLSGQNNFGNRGCEALVRSTVELLQAEFGEIEVLVPSYHPNLDAKQWPDAKYSGCRFVRAESYPIALKVWGRARKFLPFLKNNYIPKYSLPKDIKADLTSCDALVLIGGDNLTLDYGIESLIWHIRFAQNMQQMGKSVMVWGASIGSFSSEPAMERFAADFLRSVDCITVRETITQKYLAGLKVEKNVSLVADGAFFMMPQPIDTAAFWPTNSAQGVLGFNISPLIQKFRPVGEHHRTLQQEVVAFLKDELENSAVSILLIPHVDPLDGASKNSDSHYMREILSMTGSYGGRISIAPDNLNAAQLKYVLAQCTYFIGARTHATIGALSSLVPTVSIAYSVKAKGLNRDLLGNEDLVLETPMVNKTSLKRYYHKLIGNRDQIVTVLRQHIPEWRERTHLSPRLLGTVLVKSSKKQKKYAHHQKLSPE